MEIVLLSVIISACASYLSFRIILAPDTEGTPRFKFSKAASFAALIIVASFALLLLYIVGHSLYVPYDYFLSHTLADSLHFLFATQHARSIIEALVGSFSGLLLGLWFAQLELIANASYSNRHWLKHRRFGFSILGIFGVLFVAFIPSGLIGTLIANVKNVEFPGGKIEFESATRETPRDIITLPDNSMTHRSEHLSEIGLNYFTYTLIQYLIIDTEKLFFDYIFDLEMAQHEEDSLKPSNVLQDKRRDPIHIGFRKILLPTLKCTLLEKDWTGTTHNLQQLRNITLFFAKNTNLSLKQELVDFIKKNFATALRQSVKRFDQLHRNPLFTKDAKRRCGALIRVIINRSDSLLPNEEIWDKSLTQWTTSSSSRRENYIDDYVFWTSIKIPAFLVALNEGKHDIWRRIAYASLLTAFNDRNRAKDVLNGALGDLRNAKASSREGEVRLMLQRIHTRSFAKKVTPPGITLTSPDGSIWTSGDAANTVAHLSYLSDNIAELSLLFNRALENGIKRYKKKAWRIATLESCGGGGRFRTILLSILTDVNNYVYTVIVNEGLWDLTASGGAGDSYLERADEFADLIRDIDLGCFSDRFQSEQELKAHEARLHDTLLRLELVLISRANLTRQAVRDHHRVRLEEAHQKALRPINKQIAALERAIEEQRGKALSEGEDPLKIRQHLKELMQDVDRALAVLGSRES